MREPATDLLELLEEARQTVAFHQQSMAYHQRLIHYWQQRVEKIEAQLPGLVEAERVAQAKWEVQRG